MRKFNSMCRSANLTMNELHDIKQLRFLTIQKIKRTDQKKHQREGKKILERFIQKYAPKDKQSYLHQTLLSMLPTSLQKET